MSCEAMRVQIKGRTYGVINGIVRSESVGRIGCTVDAVPYAPEYVRTVTMCLHLTGRCNLACKYCFKNVCGELDFSDICRFVDCVLQVYPNADRYIVDMSGSGEPLLRKDLIISVARYCKKLSDKYIREFLPTLVTNGTLLDKESVRVLQQEGVLFGVSIDGNREIHDRNRVYPDGRGSYDDIKRQAENIEQRDYVGAAVTYSDGNLLKSFLAAFELFPTVSMKPLRYTDKQLNYDEICNGYDELADFVFERALRHETKYIEALINGDDYFGKFLRRVVLGINVYGRCDAGFGRFALAGDKKIYCCPAATGISDGVVGDLDLGIRRSKLEKFWKNQRNDGCKGCYARPACGGECKIVSYNKYGNFDGIDSLMCKIKKHLYLLAVWFSDELKEQNNKIYEWLTSTSRKIEAYYSKDDRLVEAVVKSNGEYTFTKLKAIKDANILEFDRIYARVCK